MVEAPRRGSIIVTGGFNLRNTANKIDRVPKVRDIPLTNLTTYFAVSAVFTTFVIHKNIFTIMAWKYHQKGRRTRLLEGCEVMKMKEYAAPTDSRQEEEEAPYLVCSKTDIDIVNANVIMYQWIYYLAASNGGEIVRNNTFENSSGTCDERATLEKDGTTYTLYNYYSPVQASLIQTIPSTSSDPSGTLHIPAGYYLIDGKECPAQDIVV